MPGKLSKSLLPVLSAPFSRVVNSGPPLANVCCVGAAKVLSQKVIEVKPGMSLIGIRLQST